MGPGLTFGPPFKVKYSLLLITFLYFSCTLKLKTESQLTQSPFMGTDCLFYDIVKSVLAISYGHEFEDIFVLLSWNIFHLFF